MQEIEKRGWYSRGYLPHRDECELTQFVTFRLFDSVPQKLIEIWRDELKYLPTNEAESQLRSRILKHIDLGAGNCFLRNAEVAALVQNALTFFHDVRYDLLEWVVMPNHVHVVIQPRPEWSLEGILHSWKSFTAKEANKLLDR